MGTASNRLSCFAEAAFAPYRWEDPLKVETTMLTEDEVSIM